MSAPELETKRLLLRHWKQSDLPLFAKMNTDPLVMEHFPALMTEEESENSAKKIQSELQKAPFGFWAVEVKRGAPFVGFVGAHQVGFEAPFTPAVEIGWRLASQHWGKGYATEAASEVVRYLLEELKLPEIVSFTATNNLRSRKLMEKLEMQRDPEEDFLHPLLPSDHRIAPHVLYRRRR